MALITADIFSECLLRTVTINAIVPMDKMTLPGQPKREQRPFKTLYLLHGIFGNYTDWITGTRIQAWAQEKNLVVIMPSGENKFYVDNPKSGEYYSEFIGRELVEKTRALFRLSDKREDTYIAGLSMGGFGALVNGLRFADTFGNIAALSSALILDGAVNATEDTKDPIGRRSFFESIFGDLDQLLGSDKDYKALAAARKENGEELPDIYMCCGTEDGLLEANRDYRDYLKGLDIPVVYEEGPGGHDWVFWDSYIKRVLDWLPLEDATESIHSGNVK